MGYSVPVPANYRDINDHFTSLIAGAPHFDMLQHAVTYTITLEMMIGALVQGIETVARRSKSESAKTCYMQAIEGIHIGFQHYSSGREPEGKKLFMQAHNALRLVANKGPRWKL
jgi:hypothetical protein